MSEQELYGIYGVWYIPFWQQSIFYGLCCLIGCIILFFGIYVFFKSMRNAKEAPLVYWQKALKDIELIRTRYQKNELYESDLYMALTGIIKEFMSIYCKVDFKAKTDDECVFALNNLVISDEKKASLERLFRGSTLIKFSSMHVSAEQIQHDLDTCSAFIQESISHATK